MICASGLPNFQINSLQFRKLDCEDLDYNEVQGQKFTRAGNWQIIDSKDRISPLIGLHSAIVSSRSTFFLPKDKDMKWAKKMIDILETTNANHEGLAAFVTSGSSGEPTVVIHRTTSLIEACNKMLSQFPELRNNVFQHLFPSTYMAGILNNTLLPWIANSKIFLDNEFSFQSPFSIGEASQLQQTRFAWLSPSMMSSLTSAAGAKNFIKPQWEFYLSATAPLFTEVRDRFHDAFGIHGFNTYGSTELLFISAEHEWDSTVTSGNPLMGVKVEMISTGEMPDTLSQEIFVETNTSPVGIIKWQDETHEYQYVDLESIKRFSTRDIGHWEGERIMLTGRTDDIIVLGGINFSLANCEKIAKSFPGVVEACAFAPYGGSFLGLTLVYEIALNSSDFSEPNYLEFLKRELGAKYFPRNLVLKKLPRTHTGKVDRQAIRKIMIASK